MKFYFDTERDVKRKTQAAENVLFTSVLTENGWEQYNGCISAADKKFEKEMGQKVFEQEHYFIQTIGGEKPVVYHFDDKELSDEAVKALGLNNFWDADFVESEDLDELVASAEKLLSQESCQN